VPGLAEVPCWTSDDILNLNFLPERIIVLGGGIVACELAQFLRRIGSEVVLIQRNPHLLKQMPKAASLAIENTLREEGVHLYTGTKLQSVGHKGGEFTVTFEQDGRSIELEAPYLLNALGREPAIQGLQLEAAEIETQPSGHITCNHFQQTTNPKIYACGDVAGPHEIVHVAILQGEVAARHATGREVDPVDYDGLISVAFTDPQVATAGLTENQLKERHIDFLAADYPFDDHGKSILMEAKHGYVKVYADRSGIVLGAECVGKDAGELIHAMAVAIQLRAKVRDLLKVHWYHPTLSEIWTYPLEDILEQL
jgi:pyruvate/2-oxoglutarate dehydrogenase complex dihydrolipoamide dehydrogenase (E3) component